MIFSVRDAQVDRRMHPQCSLLSPAQKSRVFSCAMMLRQFAHEPDGFVVHIMVILPHVLQVVTDLVQVLSVHFQVMKLNGIFNALHEHIAFRSHGLIDECLRYVIYIY